MRLGNFRSLALISATSLLAAGTGVRRSDTGAVFDKPVVFSIHGSGTDSIQDLATDGEGNIYVAGTTSSPDLPVKNAAQPAMGESQLLRSTDRGVTWTRGGNMPSVDPLTIASDPASPHVLFVGAQEGIFKSTDGGVTWRAVYRMAQLSSGWGVFSIVVDPGNPARLAALAYPGGILVSADHGETWSVSVPSESLYVSSRDRLLADPFGSGTLLLVSTSLRISPDAGRTWELLRPPPPPGFPAAATFDPHHRGWIYLATAAGTLGRFFLTTDAGANWTEKTNPRSAIYDDLRTDPDQPNVLYASALDGLYRSDDAGASWRGPLIGYTGRMALLPASCGGAVLLLGDSNIYTSLDGGATWAPKTVSQTRDITAAGDCAVYALRAITSDAFVAKVSPDGQEVLWSTYLGGENLDSAKLTALDATGNVYVAGTTQSVDFPLTGERLGTPGLRPVVFLTKFGTSGKLLYSTVLGGVMDVRGLAVDSGGNAHLVGETVNPGVQCAHLPARHAGCLAVRPRRRIHRQVRSRWRPDLHLLPR